MMKPRQSLSEDIGKLRSIWNKMKRNEASKKLLTDKMAIKLHMLGSLVKHMILRNMYGCLVVRVKRNWNRRRNSEIREQLNKPSDLCSDPAYRPILCFNRGKRNERLLL